MTLKNNISTEVKKILHEKGLSSLFNMNDYLFLKKQCKKAFNPALEIAQKFIEYHEPQKTDFSDYEQ